MSQIARDLTNAVDWTRPWTAQHQMTVHPTWQLLEYVCEENNR